MADTPAESTSVQRAPGITNTDRAVFLSDGIFAIAMTLLVLEIGVTSFTGKSYSYVEAHLPAMLSDMASQISGYALSFIIIALFWRVHTRMFNCIVRADGLLIWLNILFLMSVAFLPVPTKVLNDYGNHGLAVRFYVGSLFITGMLAAAIWTCAASRRLISPTMEASAVRHFLARALIAPAVFIVAFVISYSSASLAEYSLILIAIFSAFYERIYQFTRRRAKANAQTLAPTPPQA